METIVKLLEDQFLEESMTVNVTTSEWVRKKYSARMLLTQMNLQRVRKGSRTLLLSPMSPVPEGYGDQISWRWLKNDEWKTLVARASRALGVQET